MVSSPQYGHKTGHGGKHNQKLQYRHSSVKPSPTLGRLDQLLNGDSPDNCICRHGGAKRNGVVHAHKAQLQPVALDDNGVGVASENKGGVCPELRQYYSIANGLRGETLRTIDAQTLYPFCTAAGSKTTNNYCKYAYCKEFAKNTHLTWNKLEF